MMTEDEAARFLAEAAGRPDDGVTVSVDQLLQSRTVVRLAYRAAAKALHPDAGGDPNQFRKLQAARDLLLAS